MGYLPVKHVSSIPLCYLCAPTNTEEVLHPHKPLDGGKWHFSGHAYLHDHQYWWKPVSNNLISRKLLSSCLNYWSISTTDQNTVDKQVKNKTQLGFFIPLWITSLSRIKNWLQLDRISTIAVAMSVKTLALNIAAEKENKIIVLGVRFTTRYSVFCLHLVKT